MAIVGTHGGISRGSSRARPGSGHTLRVDLELVNREAEDAAEADQPPVQPQRAIPRVPAPGECRPHPGCPRRGYAHAQLPDPPDSPLFCQTAIPGRQYATLIARAASRVAIISSRGLRVSQVEDRFAVAQRDDKEVRLPTDLLGHKDRDCRGPRNDRVIALASQIGAKRATTRINRGDVDADLCGHDISSESRNACSSSRLSFS